MTKTETLLRALLGPIRDDVRPLAAVIDYVAALLGAAVGLSLAGKLAPMKKITAHVREE